MTPDFDRQTLDSLSTGERALLDFIIDHQEQLAKLSIQELAEMAFTSPATVVRLCKKFGFDGFSELKFLLREKKRKSNTLPDPSLELKGVISRSFGDLTQTIRGIRQETLAFITDCLCSDKNLYLFARGMSYMPITYMHQVLLSVDRDCLCFIDPPLMLQAAQNMTAEDVVIIASSGGATDGIQRAAQMAKEHGAAVIALTSDARSPLAAIADIHIHCHTPNRYRNGIDIKSRFTMMFVIDLIINCYLNRMNLNPPSDPSIYINQKNW